jgi:hypothetical protein
VVCAASCATAGAGGEGQREDADPFASAAYPQTVRLIVQNRNFSDARIYVLRYGGRRPLGVVGGKRDAEFVMEWRMSEGVRIEIDLLAGPRCTTEELIVDPGDILELQIDVVFSRTSLCR